MTEISEKFEKESCQLKLLKLNLTDKLIGSHGYQWLEKKWRIVKHVKAILIINNSSEYPIYLIRDCLHSWGICYTLRTQNECMMRHLLHILVTLPPESSESGWWTEDQHWAEQSGEVRVDSIGNEAVRGPPGMHILLVAEVRPVKQSDTGSRFGPWRMACS